MSDSNKDVKFSFKAVINQQKTKVLFAEIDNHFADVLFSFLTLPLGRIVRVQQKHYGDAAPVFGSLTTLYNGLSNLDEAYFCAEGCKQMLINPVSSFSDQCRNLKLDIGGTQPTKYFSCEDWSCVYTRAHYIGMYHPTVRCACGKLLNREIPVRNKSKDVSQVFTKKNSTFLLSDDLEILPNSATSVRIILDKLGLMDIDGTELMNVTFGFNEIMDLLKYSLLGPTPLTNLVLKKQMKCEPILFQIEIVGCSADIEFVVKVILVKSSRKLLFVEAEEDFVEYLFSLLTIPLGKVEYHMHGGNCLKNIDKLYRSIAIPMDRKYLIDLERIKLNNPALPCGYQSKNCIFPLFERDPGLQYHRTTNLNEEYFTPVEYSNCTFRSPKGHGNYVKGPRKYMVKDDLTATPFCIASYFSAINGQKIPLCDVEELELNIRSQEAMDILKASLISTCALSIGLGHLLKKIPKQEQ